MKWVCCDPGLSTGLAFFSNRKLIHYFTIRGRGSSWEEKTKNVSFNLFHVFEAFNPKKIFIEFPTFHFRGNIKSLIKLSFLIGRISEVWSGEIILLPVNTWKGNLPKAITWRRAEKFFNVQGLSADSGDAVAIGRWIIKKNLWR